MTGTRRGRRRDPQALERLSRLGAAGPAAPAGPARNAAADLPGAVERPAVVVPAKATGPARAALPPGAPDGAVTTVPAARRWVPTLLPGESRARVDDPSGPPDVRLLAHLRALPRQAEPPGRGRHRAAQPPARSWS